MLKTVVNCHVWNRGLQNQTEKVPCTVFLNYLHTFVFNIFSVLIFFIYVINSRYWQVLFIYNIGRSQSATSTFKYRGSIAAVLVISFKKLFSFWRYSIVCISIFPSFFSYWSLLQRMIVDKSYSFVILKFSIVFNNLITHFV